MTIVKEMELSSEIIIMVFQYRNFHNQFRHCQYYNRYRGIRKVLISATEHATY